MTQADEIAPPSRWRTPEDLLRIGLTRSRLILINEAHNGLLRVPRTRRVGQRLVREADRVGVRHLAMEALPQGSVVDDINRTRRLPTLPGYLGQPEMREFIHTVLELGWTLLSYEADMRKKPREFANLSIEETNWREQQQAENVTAVFDELPEDARLVVWCGNHHLAKRAGPDWLPMGAQLEGLSGVAPFAIDQLATVIFDSALQRVASRWQHAFANELDAFGGTAGFLAEEAPPGWWADTADAYLLSTDNEFV